MRTAMLALSGATLLAGAALAETDTHSAAATLKDVKGNSIGTVALRQTASDGVWLNVSLANAPAGTHAFHIHEKGVCEGNFESAGGHFAPEHHKHGVLVEGGPHAGDMPNLHIPATGELNIEIFAPLVSLDKGAKNSLLDGDGSALIIHAGVDDYKSQPAGAAGDRIVCGVIANVTGEK